MQCGTRVRPSSGVTGFRPARKALVGWGADCCGFAHEVSIFIAVGRWRGWQPASKVSMTNMRPPQHGQGWASACAAAGSISAAASAAGVANSRFTRSRDRLRAICAGKKAVVADAMEAFGQHVDEEPADELADVEPHRRVPAGAFDPVVLDLECDAPPVDCDQAMVRDGDAVRIP